MKILNYLFSKQASTSTAAPRKDLEPFNTSLCQNSDRSDTKYETVKKKPGVVQAPAPSKPHKSPNVQAVESFVHKWTNFKDEKAVMSHFVSHKSRMILEDGVYLSPQKVAGSLKLLHASFPDLQFQYASIQETSPNQIVVEGFYAVGTHTGAPYTPMPGKLPAIAAAGKHVRNDEATFYCQLQDHKIQSIEVIAMGSKTGPVGMYELVGGRL